MKRRLAIAAVACALLTTGLPQAEALDPDAVQVPVEFRAGRVLLVRPNRVDVVENGRLLKVVPVAGPVDLGRLPQLVGNKRFASQLKRGVVRLDATIAQRPGSRLTGAAPRLTRLQVISGRRGGHRIIGTRAGLTLDGVTVESVTTNGRPAAASPKRGSVRYTHGSEVSISRSRLHNLGSTGLAGRPALEVSGGSTLHMVRSRITGGTTGLRLDAAGAVSLDRLLVERSQADGITASGGSKLSIATLTTRDNAGGGMLLRGPVNTLKVSGPITASGNRGVGVRLTDLHGATLRKITTSRNGDGGISVRGGQALTLAGLRSNGDVTGIAVASSSGVRLRGVVADRVASGLVVKDSNRITASDVKVTAARDEGISVSGRQITVTRGQVARSGEGLVIGNSARDVTVSDSTLEGERAAIRAAPGSADVTVRHVVARSANAVAIRSSATPAVLTDVNAGGVVGMDLRGRTVVDHSVISASGQALRAGPAAAVRIETSTLTSRELGISAAQGSQVTVQTSRVLATRATDGRVSFGTGNNISRLPIRWVAIAGLIAMVLAIGLEILRKLRERGERRVEAPVHVLNRT